jgi:hypothetical protein
MRLAQAGSFLENCRHSVTGTQSKCRQIIFLPLARLIGGRNTAIDCGALSQLNPYEI